MSMLINAVIAALVACPIGSDSGLTCLSALQGKVD
jgi:hypothetical protein